jgi:hypothetical protein
MSVGVYELVQHDVKPGLLSQFEQVIEHGFPARLKYDYPKPVGMWYTDIGPSQRGKDYLFHMVKVCI